MRKKKIEEQILEELIKKYGSKKIPEKVISVDEYKSLPITMPASPNELPLILENVIAVIKEKNLEDGSTIKLFEIFDCDENKLLETIENGRIKLDKEIIDDKLKDIIKNIQENGYEAAGISSLDDNGTIDSYFEIINGKIMALNKEQKEKLDRTISGEERERTLTGIYKSNIEPNVKKNSKSQNVEKEKRGNEEMANVTANEKDEDKVDVYKTTAVINDSIFKRNEDITSGNKIKGALTKDGRAEIVEEVDGEYKKVKGFKEGNNRNGEIFAVSSDTQEFGEQQHTFGEIESENGNVYSVTKGQYDDIHITQKEKSTRGKNAKNEEYAAGFTVQDDGLAYHEVDREGNENGNNIYARTRDKKSTNYDQHYSGDGKGKGGVAEIADTNKKHTNYKDYTMDGFSSHQNPKLDTAMALFHEELKKNGISLDPDVETEMQRKIEVYIENSNQVFCEDNAKAYVLEAQMEMANKNNRIKTKEYLENEKQKNEEEYANNEVDEQESEEERTLANDAEERRRRRGHM